MKHFSMSEKMQSRAQKDQGSKFWEGRLKLSTSCTECHRRKQKVRFPFEHKSNLNTQSVVFELRYGTDVFSVINGSHADIAQEDFPLQDAFI